MFFSKLQFHPVVLVLTFLLTGWLFDKQVYYDMAYLFSFWVAMYLVLDGLAFIGKMLWNTFTVKYVRMYISIRYMMLKQKYGRKDKDES